MKMLKDRWLPFLINGLFSLRKLRSVIYDESVDSSCFVLWELISTGQIKSRCWRTRVLKLLVELWALHLACGYPYINIIYTLTIYSNICKIYIWKRSMKSFSWESSGPSAFYILDLVKTVWVLQILLQKFARNFGIKELRALKNHVLVNMLLFPIISQRYIKYTLVHSLKVLAYLFHILLI